MSASAASRTLIAMTLARSRRSRSAAVAGALAQQPPFFAIPVAKLLGFALVVLLFAAWKAHFQLDATLGEVQIQGREGVARPFDFTDEPVDLDSMHQQLARARRIGPAVRRRGSERRNVRAKQHDFTILDDHVSFLQLRTAGANRLDFPAFERDASLEFLLDKVVVVGFFVFDDGHWRARFPL